MNNKKWWAVGYLPTGEAVYQHEAGAFAKYMDYNYLVGMTREELKAVIPERSGLRYPIWGGTVCV